MNVRCDLNINGGSRRVLLAAKEEETPEHMALRLTAAILFFDREPALDTGPSDPALADIGFIPDLMVPDGEGSVGQAHPHGPRGHSQGQRGLGAQDAGSGEERGHEGRKSRGVGLAQGGVRPLESRYQGIQLRLRRSLRQLAEPGAQRNRLRHPAHRLLNRGREEFHH